MRIRTLSEVDSVDGIAQHEDLPVSLQFDFNINYTINEKSSASLYMSNTFNEDDRVAATVFNGSTEQFGNFARLEYIYKF